MELELNGLAIGFTTLDHGFELLSMSVPKPAINIPGDGKSHHFQIRQSFFRRLHGVSLALLNTFSPSLELLSDTILVFWEILGGLILAFLDDGLVKANVHGTILTGNHVFGARESGAEAYAESARAAVGELDGGVDGVERRKMGLELSCKSSDVGHLC